MQRAHGESFRKGSQLGDLIKHCAREVTSSIQLYMPMKKRPKWQESMHPRKYALEYMKRDCAVVPISD